MDKREIILDKDKILKEGLQAPEVIELQRILDLQKDGIFGKNTLYGVRWQFHREEISLNILVTYGFFIRNAIPIQEVYWLSEPIIKPIKLNQMFPEKIFIDDALQPQHIFGEDGKNWHPIGSYLQLRTYINKIIESADESNMPKEVSFDFKLGYTEDGIDCATVLIETCIKYGLELPKCYVHSSGGFGVFLQFQKLFETKWKEVTGKNYELIQHSNYIR